MRRKQRKPTARELVRTLIGKCGLSQSRRTDNVLTRQQLAELVVHVENQDVRIRQLPEMEGQRDAKAQTK